MIRTLRPVSPAKERAGHSWRKSAPVRPMIVAKTRLQRSTVSSQLPSLISYLRRAIGPEQGHQQSDSELLERFVLHRDESAFELLVWRHSQTV
jgi:hypothetical protein